MPIVPVAGNDVAYALYTSGSTGTPKAALLTHTNLANVIQFCLHSGWVDSTDTCDNALRKAGFTSVAQHLPQVSPEGMKDRGERFWDAYRARPFVMILEAR